VLPVQRRVLDGLLLFLVRPGELVRRDELMETLWPDVVVTDNSIDQLVRMLRKTLGDKPRTPRFVETVAGLGYRFIATVRQVDQGSSTGRTRTNLPAADFRFIGRESALQNLRQQLETGRLVTVLGPGGCGKTRLTRHLAIEVAQGPSPPEGGVWFCDLTPARDRRGVLAALRSGLNLSPSGPGVGTSEIEHLVERLREGPSLVLLDNAEQVAAEVADLAATLLARAPGLRLLVTSRERLRIDVERCTELDPLPVPDAVSMLRDRADAVRQGLGAFDEATATAIVERLEGMPLSIVLAAPRLLLLSPQVLLKRLEARVGWLASKDRSLANRQASLTASVAWSWDLLSEAEQRVAAESSVFRGGFTVEAAEAVLETGDPDVDVDEILLSLRDASLLRALHAAGTPRFALWEPAREFAELRLRESGREDAVRLRHAAWCGALLEDATLDQRDLIRVRGEVENLWAALATLEDPDAVCVFSVALAQALYNTAEVGATWTALERAVALSRERPSIHYGRVLRERFRLALFTMRDLSFAQQSAQSLLKLADTIPELAGDAQMALGHCALERDGPDTAEPHFRGALTAFLASDDRLGVIRARIRLGVVARRKGLLSESEAELTTALQRLREQYPRAERVAGVLVLLAQLYEKQGRYEDHATALREAIGLMEEVDNRRALATAFRGMADNAHACGDLDAAEAYIHRALTLPMSPAQLANARFCLGRVLISRGKRAAGRAELAASEATFLRGRATGMAATAIAFQALALAMDGLVDEASRRAREADARFLEAGLGPKSGALCCAIADALGGRLDEARTTLDAVDWAASESDDTSWMFRLAGALISYLDGDVEACAEVLAAFDARVGPCEPTLRWIRALIDV